MKNIYYTYIYLDPRKSGHYECGDYTFDHEPFYVGKGKDQQYIMHLLQSKNNNDIPLRENRHKFHKIKNILKENLEPIILKVKENISEQEAFELEICLIWAIGRSDLKLGPLTNLTDGGEGTQGRICRKRTKNKISKSNKGKIRTEEFKNECRERKIGKLKAVYLKRSLSLEVSSPS